MIIVETTSIFYNAMRKRTTPRDKNNFLWYSEATWYFYFCI